MAKALSANVQTQQAAEEKRPVNLVILSLDTGTLRYAAAKNNVTFPTGGNVYTAKALSYDSVSTSLEGQVSRISIRLDNTIRDMASYHYATPFKGRSIVVWKVYHDALGAAADYEEVFNGTMEEPNFDYNWINIPATAGTGLAKKYPL